MVLCSQLLENMGLETRDRAEVVTLTIIPRKLLAEICAFNAIILGSMDLQGLQ